MVLACGLFFVVTPILAQDDANRRILKQGLIGAGTGAIAAEASGGKAGKGALIGAGTGILGNILLDTLTESPQQQAPSPRQRERATKTVDLYQEAYQEGYADGFRDGYQEATESTRR
jgi:hypothetical protein